MNYLGYNADVICLQEVDNKVFDGDLVPILSSLGYQGLFSKKGGQVSEGTACFFHTSKFRLILSESTVLAAALPENPLLADLYAAVIRNEKLASRVMDRTTAVQLVVLESVHDSARRIVVANTHLYFHPDADHVRLLQAAMGLRLAQQMHEKQKVGNQCSSSLQALCNASFRVMQEQGKDVSLVFCGDFNSCPGYGVLEMMTLQHIDENYDAWSSSKLSYPFLVSYRAGKCINRSILRCGRGCDRTGSFQPHCHGVGLWNAALH